MTNYERIMAMTPEELATVIIQVADSSDAISYCKSDCAGDFESDNPDEMCPHPAKCCARWLMEEAT